MKERKSVQKVLAWILVVTIVMSIGMSAWADEPMNATETIEEREIQETETEVAEQDEIQSETEQDESQSEIEQSESQSEIEQSESQSETEQGTETEVQGNKHNRAAGDDRTADFQLDSVYIKIINESKTVYESNKTNPDRVTMEYAPKFEFNLTFSQKDVNKKDFVEGEYIEFEIVNIKGSANGQFDNLSLPSELFDNGVALGTGEVASRIETDGSVTLYYRVTFGSNIESKSDIKGEAEGGATIKGGQVGEIITVERNGQKLVELELVALPSIGDGHPIVLYPDYGFGTKKQVGSTDASKDTVTWNIIMSEFFFKQFEDFDAGIAADYGDIIIEDEPDEYQTFFGAGNDTHHKEVAVSLTAQVFTYNPDEIGSDGQLQSKKKTYYMKTAGWFYLSSKDPAKNKGMTFYEPGDTAASHSAAEAYVRVTPKTWTVFKNPDTGKEKLIINVGAPGSTGLKYSDIFTDAEFTALKVKMQRGVQLATEVLAAADAAHKTDPNDELTDSEGQTAKRSAWEVTKKAYQAAVDFYATDPCVSYFWINVDTKVLRDKAIADGIASVENNFGVSGSFGSKDGAATRDNFWSGTLTGVAVNGDVQIFKADALYGNSENKTDAKAIDGFMGQVEFEVYKADGTGPLKFDLASGKYEYSAAGALTTVTTNTKNGSAIVSKLDTGSYYFKEVAAPDGYYTGQNQRVDFTIDNSYVSYRLANNAPRGVQLVKVKKDTPATKLSDAVFELYTYTTDIENAKKVDGFTLTTIDGKQYYICDGGSDTLKTLADGTLKIVQLPAGKYYLQEAEAPSGYQVSDEKHTFVLTEQLSAGQAPIIDLGEIENTPDIKVEGETSVAVTKEWVDNEDKAGLRPESITLELYQWIEGDEANKILFDTQTISEAADGTWGYEWDALPQYDSDSNTYQYEVKEQAVAGYTTTYDRAGGKIINALAPSGGLLAANVEITKSVDKAAAEVNDILTYTLTVKHIGDAVTITNIEVVDFIPERTKFYSAEDGGEYVWEEDDTHYVKWMIDSLSPGESISLTFKVKVDECVPGTVIRNTAILKSESGVSAELAEVPEMLDSNEVTSTVSDESQKPGTAKRNSMTSKNTKTSSAVQTGDNTTLISYILLLLFAGAVGMILLIKKRKT